MIAFAELSPAIPHHPAPKAGWWAGGMLLTLAALALTLARPPGRLRWLRYLPLILFLVAVQMLRAADGNGSAGFSPLLILPVIWYALYSDRVGVWLALAGVAAVQFVPLIVVGAPQYPVTLWRAGVLWVVILGLTGLAAQRLVGAIRSRSAALATNEERFRTAFADAPTGVALVGATGPHIGVYLQVNRALAALLGRSEDELLGRSVLEVTHPDDHVLTEKELLAPAERQIARSVQKRYLHSSGREVPVRLTYSRVMSGPYGEACFVVHVEDITASRDAHLEMLSALDQERESIARLERLELRRGQLISALANDVVAPLSSIAAMVETLRSDTERELTARQLGRLREIEHHLARVDAIVSQVVTGDQPAPTTTVATPRAVDIAAVTRAAVESIRPLAEGRELALQVDIDLGGVQVDGEAAKIERVLLGLLDNAVKFTPPGGAIDVQGRARAQTVVVEVTDTGIGINPDDQPRIFERFYRAPDAAQQAIPGTGLGLAIAKAITEQHHGTLQVFSEPGVGSSFTLTLPMREAHALV